MSRPSLAFLQARSVSGRIQRRVFPWMLFQACGTGILPVIEHGLEGRATSEEGRRRPVGPLCERAGEKQGLAPVERAKRTETLPVPFFAVTTYGTDLSQGDARSLEKGGGETPTSRPAL